MSLNPIILARMQQEAFCVEPKFANSLLANIKAFREGSPSETHTELSNDLVTYQVVNGNIAVIGIDGVMYKKSLKDACTNVISYDEINKAIDKAEADINITIILFRVDTRGGSVAGADEVRDRIYTSPKRTITFFENIGASGGVWVFTASNEVYASESTVIGSIGVIVMYQNPRDEDKVLAIVSSNAPNKFCDIEDENCKNRIQTRLTEYETMFLDRLVEHYPTKTKENIIEDFNKGDTIFANDAKTKGYLNEVLTFKSLMKTLSPSMGQIANQTRGNDMAQKVDDKIEVLKEVKTEPKAIIETVKESFSAEAQKEITAMTFEMQVPKDIAMKMAETNNVDKAKIIMADAMKSSGMTFVGEETQVVTKEPIANHGWEDTIKKKGDK